MVGNQKKYMIPHENADKIDIQRVNKQLLDEHLDDDGEDGDGDDEQEGRGNKEGTDASSVKVRLKLSEEEKNNPRRN
jgi:hypothetical protein